MKRCSQCGTVLEMHRGSYAYQPGLGMAPITLQEVEQGRCPACGEEIVGIPKLLPLHTAIAHALARQKTRLIPAEIRFLRDYLGWSGTEMARQLDVTPQTVSRWENGKQQMATPTEKLLRLSVLYPREVEETPTAVDLPTDPELPRFSMHLVDGQWQITEGSLSLSKAT